MPVHAIHHFNIRAPLEEVLVLRDFYCNVVGLTLGPRPPFRSTGFRLYAEDVAVLHLSVSTVAESLPEVCDRKSAVDHLAFKSSNVQATLDNLREHGVAYELDTVPLLNQTQIFFRDPSGVGVELNFEAAEAPTA
jgi:glyoxylase I family protein